MGEVGEAATLAPALAPAWAAEAGTVLVIAQLPLATSPMIHAMILMTALTVPALRPITARAPGASLVEVWPTIVLLALLPTLAEAYTKALGSWIALPVQAATVWSPELPVVEAFPMTVLLPLIFSLLPSASAPP